MKVQLIMTFFAAQPSDKCKVSDAQLVVVFVNTSKNTVFITVINSFTVFVFYLVKIFQFYSFIVLSPPLILGKQWIILGVCENAEIFDGRDESKRGRVPENFEIPEGIRFPEKVTIPKNFEHPATVSRTTLQCCIAAYKIYKYTVQFLLPVKLLETRILRIVWPDVNERVTACLALGHYVRCWAVSLRNSGSSDVYFKICVNLIKFKIAIVRVKLW